MKKCFNLFLTVLLPLAVCLLFGCSPNNIQNLAKELDTSVNNFVNSVSNLDWPDNDLLNSLTNNSEDLVYAGDTEIDSEELQDWIDTLELKIETMNAKRDDLSYATNQLYSNNVKLDEDGYLSIKVYMDIIKDNSNYLSNYHGMLKNQLLQANQLISNEEKLNIVNAYVIKAVETLQLRCAKIDTATLSMNSIIEIIDANLINKKNAVRHIIKVPEPQPKIEGDDEDDINNVDSDDNQSNDIIQNEDNESGNVENPLFVVEDNIVEANNQENNTEIVREIYKEKATEKTQN